MLEQKSELRRRQMSDAFNAFATAKETSPPRGGWVRAIREALGMTQGQLAARVGVARQSVQDLENAEADRRITLDSLDRLARAMDCRVVYALVPEGESLDALRERQAKALAKVMLESTGHSMTLEAQGVSDSAMERQHEFLTQSLLRGSPRKLWR